MTDTSAIDEAREIVERTVWCTVTTVGADLRPRSRLMHPVWWWDGDAPVALVTARATRIKVAHLAANPQVACFYWSPEHHHTAELDCTAVWLEPDEIEDAWHRIIAVPPPMGFDPAIVWPAGPTDPGVRMLRFDAHRVVARRAGAPASAVWRG